MRPHLSQVSEPVASYSDDKSESDHAVQYLGYGHRGDTIYNMKANIL